MCVADAVDAFRFLISLKQFKKNLEKMFSNFFRMLKMWLIAQRNPSSKINNISKQCEEGSQGCHGSDSTNENVGIVNTDQSEGWKKSDLIPLMVRTESRAAPLSISS